MRLAATPLLLATIALTTAGCSAYHAKDPARPHLGGYSQERLADDRFVVVYEGDMYDGDKRLIELWEKRAGELCKGKPYSGRPTITSRLEGGYGGPYRYPTARGQITCRTR